MNPVRKRGRLADKVAVVTGGANGIGEAIVELFVAQGAKVVIGDLDDERGVAVAARHLGRAIFRRSDVTADDDIAALVASAVTEFGRLDIMVNNAAASGDRAALAELTPGGFLATVDLVAASVLSGHRHASRRFIEQGGGGVIVSTASVAAAEGGWGPAAYTIAKHAVIGIVRAATAELAPLGIRSNAVAPGAITTPGSARALGIPEQHTAAFVEFMEQRTVTLQPLPRAGRAEDVAQAVLFLASDESAWISGAVLPVDGGSTAVALGGAAPIGLAGIVPETRRAVAEFLSGLNES